MSKKRKIWSIRDVNKELLTKLLKAVKSYNLKVNLIIFWNVALTIALIILWLKK